MSLLYRPSTERNKIVTIGSLSGGRHSVSPVGEQTVSPVGEQTVSPVSR